MYLFTNNFVVIIFNIPYLPFSNITSYNYDVADWSSLGHVIVTRHVRKNKMLDLTPTVHVTHGASVRAQ